jgi:hypothetical protein
MPTGDVPPRTAGAPLIVEALEHPTIATLEDGEGARLVVPRAWLPRDAADGDVLRAIVEDGVDGRTVHLRIDAEATAKRGREMQERRDHLPRAPGGDLDL